MDETRVVFRLAPEHAYARLQRIAALLRGPERTPALEAKTGQMTGGGTLLFVRRVPDPSVPVQAESSRSDVVQILSPEPRPWRGDDKAVLTAACRPLGDGLVELVIRCWDPALLDAAALIEDEMRAPGGEPAAPAPKSRRRRRAPALRQEYKDDKVEQYRRLLEEDGLTQEAAASKLNEPRSTLEDWLEDWLERQERRR